MSEVRADDWNGHLKATRLDMAMTCCEEAKWIDLERHKLLAGRKDKQFIWQTCTGPGKIEAQEAF